VLDVLFWGLIASPVAWTSFMEAQGKVNSNFFIKKNINFLFSCKFLNFWSWKPGSGLDPDSDRFKPKMLDPESINPDPKQCLKLSQSYWYKTFCYKFYLVLFKWSDICSNAFNWSFAHRLWSFPPDPKQHLSEKHLYSYVCSYSKCQLRSNWSFDEHLSTAGSVSSNPHTNGFILNLNLIRFAWNSRSNSTVLHS
jgi:hypothetical protein